MDAAVDEIAARHLEDFAAQLKKGRLDQADVLLDWARLAEDGPGLLLDVGKQLEDGVHPEDLSR